VFGIAPMAESDESLWDTMMNVNVKGTYFVSRAALPALKKARGSIVNVASEAGLIGAPGMTVYCASKGAIVNLTRAMALELAPTVRVNCVCPGTIDTDMARAGFGFDGNVITNLQAMTAYYPMKRIGRADEVAAAILIWRRPMPGSSPARRLRSMAARVRAAEAALGARCYSSTGHSRRGNKPSRARRRSTDALASACTVPSSTRVDRPFRKATSPSTMTVSTVPARQFSAN
jgi:NAD(P)-dependent dehydrogenase (short-subunit alcohol dehydrogenase family)